jgi:hypothetical protein
MLNCFEQSANETVGAAVADGVALAVGVVMLPCPDSGVVQPAINTHMAAAAPKIAARRRPREFRFGVRRRAPAAKGMSVRLPTGQH